MHGRRCRIATGSRQQRGFLHGGVTTALADTAAGYAAYSLMPAGSAPLTVEFKINLMAPAVGERFIASAKVAAVGPHADDRRSRRQRAQGRRETKPIARMLDDPDLHGKYARTRAAASAARAIVVIGCAEAEHDPE